MTAIIPKIEAELLPETSLQVSNIPQKTHTVQRNKPSSMFGCPHRDVKVLSNVAR
jgi:hypothetical protein